MKSCKIIIMILLILFLLVPYGYNKKVTVQNRKILLNGKIFIIKGVGYAPMPIGSNYSYEYWNNPTVYTQDFRLMQEMGVNTVKMWQTSTQQNFGVMLDAMTNYGLYAVPIYYPPDNPLHGFGWSDRASRDYHRITNGFMPFVNQWKDKKAMLMWCIGNEQNYRTSDKYGWYTFIQECASNAHLIDTNHLVTTANGAFNEVSYYDSRMPDLDAWGANYYPGTSFASIFISYAKDSAKPLWFAEFGCDAGKYGVEDQAGQALVIKSQWQSIEDNISMNNGICSGGCLMEWNDEWWKSGSPNTHEFGGFTGTSDPRDNIFDEEYWGIVDIYRNKRQAYYTLRDECFKKVSIYLDPQSPVTSGQVNVIIYPPMQMLTENLRLTWPDNNQVILSLTAVDDYYTASFNVQKSVLNGTAELFFWGDTIEAETVTNTLDFIIDTVPPEAPEELKVTFKKDANYLVWSKARDNITSVIGYNVYRSINDRDYIKLNGSYIAQREYVDSNVVLEKNYFYKITAVDEVHLESPFSPEIKIVTLEDELLIIPNYLNYADLNKLYLQIYLAQAQEISIHVYDLNGRLVYKILDRENRAAGIHFITWDAQVHDSPLNNGVYLVYYMYGSNTEIQKFMVLKE